MVDQIYSLFTLKELLIIGSVWLNIVLIIDYLDRKKQMKRRVKNG